MNQRLTRRRFGKLAIAGTTATAISILANKTFAQTRLQGINVLTQHNDNSRTGAYGNEAVLKTSNVNQHQFGKLFTRPVDGHIYAQPLYLYKVNIPNQGIHNVVYVATMHNTVYAFDADNPKTPNPLWETSLEPSVPLPDANIGNSGYHDISVEVGILSTPVISLDHNALYIVSFTKDDNGYSHWLHALDLLTGEEKFGGPTQISASVPGTGDGSINGSVTFISNKQLQRTGLLLANDIVYIAFASYGDIDPYHGWVFGYSATNLALVALFNDTPNGQEGGIWQAGQGPTADSEGNLYLLTGNGSFSPNGSALGNSFVKLKPDLTLADWFSPYNRNELNDQDCDLGSSGILLIPGTNLILGGGKEGIFYLLDRNNLGRDNSANGNDAQIVQSFAVVSNPNCITKDSTQTHHIHGGPLYWNGPNGPYVYVWPENDYLKAFKLVNGQFQTKAALQSTTTKPRGIAGGSPGMPGGMLSISANGRTAGTGIVWASHPYDRNANTQVVTGILRAYNASDLKQELWHSKQNSIRDDVGNFAKFCPPTVANGKVYLATFSGYLAVYGLLPGRGKTRVLATSGK